MSVANQEDVVLAPAGQYLKLNFEASLCIAPTEHDFRFIDFSTDLPPRWGRINKAGSPIEH